MTSRRSTRSGDRTGESEALRESEANLRAVLDASDESMTLWAVDGTLLTVNRVAAQRMRRSPADLVGRNAAELFPTRARQLGGPHIARAVATGQPVSFEDERDGGWMANRVQPILDADGTVVRLAVYSRDLTERRSAELEIRRIKAAVESSNNAVVIIGPDQVVLYQNPAMVALCGYTVGGLNAAGGPAILSGKDDHHPGLGLALRDCQSWEGEFLLRNRRGLLVPTWLRCDCIRGDDGEAVGLVGVLTDLSEIRQVEDRLRVEQDALRESEQRYRALAAENACLATEARQFAQLKAALFDDLNHRVKNGLSLILAIINMESRRACSTSQDFRRTLHGLEARIASLSLVHNLLSGREPGPLPFVTVARTVIRSALAGAPPGLEVSLELEADDDASRMLIAAGRAPALALVLNELTTNSLKHAWPGGGRGRIRVRCSRQDGPAPACLIEYGDDGVGWPADVLDGSREGVGLRLVRLAAQSPLQAALALKPGAPGASVELTIRHGEDERASSTR